MSRWRRLLTLVYSSSLLPSSFVSTVIALERILTLSGIVILGTSTLQCRWIFCRAERWSFRWVRTSVWSVLLMFPVTLPQYAWQSSVDKGSQKASRCSQSHGLSYWLWSITSADAFLDVESGCWWLSVGWMRPSGHHICIAHRDRIFPLCDGCVHLLVLCGRSTLLQSKGCRELGYG